jgi:RHS repeat-associated protein
MIAETTGGSLTSTKQFVWDIYSRCEARRADGAVSAQYFGHGQILSGVSYFYAKDHLKSIRELTSISSAIEAQYSYTLFGQSVVLQGPVSSDFQFAGYYQHAPSSLSLTTRRSYSAHEARWLNRDPLSEQAGTNL